nr:monofunctional biosynthetic peptidoglycan transglycosylase [Verticiella sediminum]
MAVLAFILLAQFWYLCWVVWYSSNPPASTPIMRSAMRELHTTRPDAELRYQWVPYERISSSLKRAVVAAEDSNFVNHGGVEWNAVRAAWEHNRTLAERRAGAGEGARVSGVMRGGSTITQQLAKNLFLSNSRSYARKGQELVITWMIEHVMSKERILELYLNVAEWGEGVFGAQAAAQHHFRTNASGLAQRQAAQLAAMLPNPRFYDQRGATRYLNSRTNTIMLRMRQVSIP